MSTFVDMPILKGWLLAVVIAFSPAVIPSPGQQQRGDLFARYPVSSLFHGKRALPKLDSVNAHMFRTRLRYAAANGPLFAGNYTLAIWGCGSSCISFAAIDLVTGKVTFFPATVSQSNEKGERLTFRQDSKAIHVIGSLNEGESVDSWYVWDGDNFKLIQTKAPQLLDDNGDDLKPD